MRSIRLAVLTGGLVACGRIGFDTADVNDAPASDVASSGPIRFVQTSAIDAGGSLTTASHAFDADVQAGDFLIVGIDINPTSVSLVQVTDTIGNTFSILGPYDGGPNRQYIAYAGVAATGPDTVTATLSGLSSEYFVLRMHEYRGIALANPFDMAAAASGTSTAVDAAQSPAITTTSPNELVFGYAVFYAACGDAGTGFTLRSNYICDVTEDMIASSPGPHTATATMQMGGGAVWTVAAAAFHGN